MAKFRNELTKFKILKKKNNKKTQQDQVLIKNVGVTNDLQNKFHNTVSSNMFF